MFIMLEAASHIINFKVLRYEVDSNQRFKNIPPILRNLLANPSGKKLSLIKFQYGKIKWFHHEN